MKTIVNTNSAPAAIGPYSQAIKANGFLFGSGQIPVDPSTGNVCSGIEASTRQVLENIKAILQSEGLRFDSVVKTTVFLRSMDDFRIVNSIYGEYFIEGAPARSCVQAVKLPKDVLIEIEFIAIA
ncbi:MAG: RidA family protein [Veillonellales bacterium]